MAGTFTHWMVVEQALDKYNRLSQKHPYFSIILGNSRFVTMGSVGPDYPYLTELLSNFLKEHSWADRMHYENSAELVGWGVRNLPNLQKQPFEICLSWLSGFTTHLVVDSIIHPVVNAVVGPYIFNKTEHRHCELTQDSFIFREIKGVELAYAAYTDILKMCSDPKDASRINPFVRDFWKQALMTSPPGAKDKFDRIDPDTWHKNFVAIISGASAPVPIFRHVGEAENLVYKRTNEITADERARFIDKVRLPGNKVGTFKEDAFNNAVDKVVEVWQRFFLDIEAKSGANWASYLKNWNLDTGVDEDKPFYW